MSIVNLQTEPIYIRSPYIIEVNQALNTGSKIDIYIWNNGTTPPTTPTYTLSKKIASPTNLVMTYNVSHYVKEFIGWTYNDLAYNVSNDTPPDTEWCYIKVSTYYETATAPMEEIDTKTWIAFDGYGYYEEGYNPELDIYGLNEGTYYYKYDATDPTGTSYLNRFGDVRVIPTEDYEFIWTNLDTLATQNYVLTAGVISGKPVLTTYGVNPTYAEEGNKLEYKDDLGTTLKTWYFKPITECRYTPVVIDFVNMLGAWQRVWFYKASITSIETTGKEHNLYKRDLINYDISTPQRRQFNVNGTLKYKLNTGYVDEEFNELVLKPLMLSEEIRLDKTPVKLNKKNTELFEHINMKLINYELEFQTAYDVINNVV